MTGNIFTPTHLSRARQFLRFCIVGSTGVVVDMCVLYLIAGHNVEGWRLLLAKAIAAEIAMLNNFLWNELWTFDAGGRFSRQGAVLRLLKFHAICGAGILWAILLLHLFYQGFRLNLFLSNLLSIGLVTIWNFVLNSRFNWRK